MTRVYFATNRNFLSAESPWFGNNPTKDGDLRFGYSNIDKSNDFKVTGVTVLPDNQPEGSFAVFAELQQIMKVQNRDTLIFIHGYNTGFTKALSDTARLIDCLTAATPDAYEPNVIAYCWPSADELLEYPRDRKEAEASAPGLARAIQKYFTFMQQQKDGQKGKPKQKRSERCNKSVHLLCHSMGNYLFRYALQSLASDNAQPSAMFREALLMAADEDNDAFDDNDKLLPLFRMARRITVYFNKDDEALAASHDINFNMTRLGATGPLHTHGIPPMIKPVDVTQVVHGLMDDDGLIQHDYYNDPSCKKVHADMAWTLLGAPSETIAGRKYNAQAGKYVLQRGTSLQEMVDRILLRRSPDI